MVLSIPSILLQKPVELYMQISIKSDYWPLFSSSEYGLNFFCSFYAGMSSRGTTASYQGSPVPAGAVEGGLISVQFSGNPSASFPNRPDSGSP